MSRRTNLTHPAFALALAAATACADGDTDRAEPALDDVRTETAALAGPAGPIELTLAHIPAAALSDMAPPMLLGRFLHESDYAAERRQVIVVSHDVWQQLGEDPAVIGTGHDVGGVTHVVIGVAPRGWANPAGANAWVTER